MKDKLKDNNKCEENQYGKLKLDVERFKYVLENMYIKPNKTIKKQRTRHDNRTNLRENKNCDNLKKERKEMKEQIIVDADRNYKIDPNIIKNINLGG